MKILLLSGYDAGSHKRWRTGLVEYFPTHEWTVLALPPRRFSWRYVGNAYSWYCKNQIELQKEYDLIICTSMVNLSALRAIQPSIATIPTALYFHENQFAYPIQHSVVQREVFHLCMQSLYSAICADTLIFNSEYNKNSFLEGVRKLLKRMPDFAPRKIVQELQNRSYVLPVPIDDELFSNPRQNQEVPHIVWNHRWEYDKGPERLRKVLQLLIDGNIDFNISIVGQQFGSKPDAFENIEMLLGEKLINFGYMDSHQEYHQLLRETNIVLSTAVHEFQGLSMLEAIALGNIPIAPNRLAYPEYVPQNLLYASCMNDPEVEAKHIFDKILSTLNTTHAINIEHYSSKRVWPKYEELLDL